MNVYFKQVETALAHRQATEHTHRPALKTVIEAIKSTTHAFNEPKHVACGAPDFLITQDATGARLLPGNGRVLDCPGANVYS